MTWGIYDILLENLNKSRIDLSRNRHLLILMQYGYHRTLFLSGFGSNIYHTLPYNQLPWKYLFDCQSVRCSGYINIISRPLRCCCSTLWPHCTPAATAMLRTAGSSRCPQLQRNSCGYHRRGKGLNGCCSLFLWRYLAGTVTLLWCSPQSIVDTTRMATNAELSPWASWDRSLHSCLASDPEMTPI
jgi:hypothetical protein